MAKKKIFISYDYENDRYWKNLLVCMGREQPLRLLVLRYVRRRVRRQYGCGRDSSARSPLGSTTLLTSYASLVRTHTRAGGSSGEIGKAVGLKKKLVSVKTDRDNTSPDAIIGVGASWAMSFTFDSIKKAIDDA